MTKETKRLLRSFLSVSINGKKVCEGCFCGITQKSGKILEQHSLIRFLCFLMRFKLYLANLANAHAQIKMYGVSEAAVSVVQ